MSRSITGVHQLHWLTLYRGWISSRLLSYTNVYVDSAGLALAYLADGEFHQSCRRTQPRHHYCSLLNRTRLTAVGRRTFLSSLIVLGSLEL